MKRQRILYVFLLGALFLIALLIGWTPLATRIDNYAYDWLMMLDTRPVSPQSIVLAIDEDTVHDAGGVGYLRDALAEGLERIAAARPKVVAVDMVLTDSGDARQNARLEAALRRVPAVLSADLKTGHDAWEMPLEPFRRAARAVGHVQFAPDRYDGVSRELALEKVAGMDRLWALSLEAFRVWTGGGPITASEDDLEVGGRRIPCSARGGLGRPIFISYVARGEHSLIPRVSVAELRKHPELASRFAGRAVFAGVTAMSATRDRAMTPFDYMTGVEIHAHAFETLAGGRFLTPARPAYVALVCLLFALAAGLTFALLSGLWAYLTGALVLLVAHALPHLLFTHWIVFPYFSPALTAWLTVSGAATYQYFAVRRQLRKSESDRARYQQAIHFVAHEMRSPLTAIQGSSELMGRYNLNEDKRKQIASMINTESKRLAGMIQTFLDVERLSEGQMSLRRETVPLARVVDICVARTRPLAERKSIRLEPDPVLAGVVQADRELLEYAVYNLLTNAVKYSPAETIVTVSSRVESGGVRLSVRDQGIGMDDKELKNIFRKFYRTRRAEASGEAGTGIGLSLVDQIVTHHGGKMEVTSAPGKGSCFTILLPVATQAAEAAAKQAATAPTLPGRP